MGTKYTHWRHKNTYIIRSITNAAGDTADILCCVALKSHGLGRLGIKHGAIMSNSKKKSMVVPTVRPCALEDFVSILY